MYGFACFDRAKRIKNHARVNEEFSIDELKQMLVAARKEIQQLRSKMEQHSQSLTRHPSGRDLELLTGDIQQFIDMDIGTVYMDTAGGSEKQNTLDRERQREREERAEERELLAMELAARKAQVDSLEEELETERMKFKDEQEQRMQVASESAALLATISELEDRLLKVESSYIPSNLLSC
jgi:chromosome segregation ATPase